MRWFLTKTLSIRPKDTDFDRMGVRYDPPQRAGLHSIVESFRQAYNLTLADDDLETLEARLLAKTGDPAFYGFAHEGLGMALTVLDFFWNRDRVQRFLPQVAGKYDFLMALGIGFALARMPWVRGGAENHARRLPPGFDGMIMNGYGFHEGVFKTRGAIENCPIPSFSVMGRRCFDHGLGRAMWFMNGASPKRIAETFAKIPAERHPDLWAGLGTAVCYAGRAYSDLVEYDSVLERIKTMAGEKHAPMLGLGVVLAAMLQQKVGVKTPWVERAAELIVGAPHAQVGAIGETAWAATTAEHVQQPFERYAFYMKAADRIFAGIAAVQATAAKPAPAGA